MRKKILLEGRPRKELAASISEIIGEKAVYTRAPLYTYEIGNITVTRDGSVEAPDDSGIFEALGTEDLEIKMSEERIIFPWFTLSGEPDEAEAYSWLVTTLVEMVKRQKRIIVSKGGNGDSASEKYQFRCFLLRLGFIGDEYKAARKILFKNLTGSSAFRTGTKGGEA